jgi:hypothetical protein
MLCMLCGCPQRASDVCVKCGETAARYYCNICKLWDDKPTKSIYHCADCGICRRGRGIGKDVFHCKVNYPPLHYYDVAAKITTIDVLRLYPHKQHGLAQVRRAVDRLQLSYLRRLHVYVSETTLLPPMWPQYSPEVFRGPWEDFIQVPHLQQELPEHGVALSQFGRGHSKPADAARVQRYEGSCAMQRLLRQEHHKVSLARGEVCHMPFIQHCQPPNLGQYRSVGFQRVGKAGWCSGPCPSRER